MEGGDAEPAREDEHENERIQGCDRGETDADGGEDRAAGNQPQRSTPVRPEAEERLNERGGHGRREEEHRRERVVEVEAVGEERDQRRHAAGREVDGEVTAGERGHRAPVDAVPHSV